MSYPVTNYHARPELFESPPEEAPLARPEERLWAGIWPASLPLLLVLIYIAIYVIRPWEKLFPFLAAVRFEFCYALLMIAVVVFSGKLRIRMGLQSAGVYLFLATYAVCAVTAWDTDLVGDAVYNQMARTVFFVILASAVIASLYDLCFVAAAYIGTMMLYLAKTHWEYWIHGSGEYRMGVRRMIGIETSYGSPNSLAMSIVISLPVLWFLWTTRKDFTANWPAFWRKNYPRLLLGYAVLSAGAVVLTNSRSGMLGFIAFVGLTAMQGRGIGRKVLCVIGGILMLGVVWLLAPEDSRNRLRTVWDPSAGPANAQASADQRMESFAAAMKIFQKFPVTGAGPGKNFNVYRAKYVDGVNLAPHNLLGEILSCFGLLGTAAFTLMVGAVLINARRIRVTSQGLAGPPGRILPRLASAMRNSILLLLFLGLAGHCADRFNWLWLGAFGIHGLLLARDAALLENEQEWQDEALPGAVY